MHVPAFTRASMEGRWAQARGRVGHRASSACTCTLPDPQQSPSAWASACALCTKTHLYARPSARSMLPAHPYAHTHTHMYTHPQHISAFLEWLIGQLRRPSSPTKSVPTATAVLAVLLKERGSRQLFLRAGGCSLLPPLLKSSNSPANSQLLYELCMCVWQMTFVEAAADALSTAGACVLGLGAGAGQQGGRDSRGRGPSAC